MKSFLKIVADDLYEKLDGQFKDTTIIFPNKRASLFFNQYLWEKSEGKTIWAPDYTTISELFASLSDYTVGDSIYLTLKLYETYAALLNPTKSIDQLMPLMEMMLSDFQDIDNNLVEPEKLFVNIADLKEMTDFTFLTQEQREALEQFFGEQFLDSPAGVEESSVRSNFFRLWNRLLDIYTNYRTRLVEEGEGEAMVYEGMLKREIIDALQSKDEAKIGAIDRKLHSQNYVMVGFNVLNRTELRLFDYIKKNRRAMFYWDYDQAYARRMPQTETNRIVSKYEAGQFILEDIDLLGDELHGRDFFNNMHTPKRITFVQSPTENAQTRYIGKWVDSVVKESGVPLHHSAVVLCNEDLLLPTVHSIKEDLDTNVTMGYPLASTPAYTLVELLLDLQLRGHTKSGLWRYRQVAAVLKHPFVKRILGRLANDTLSMLTQKNMSFVSPAVLSGNEAMCRLFVPVTGSRLTAYLAEVLALVGQTYGNTLHKAATLQLHKEAIFQAHNTINRIHLLQESHPSVASLSNTTLQRLILQFLNQASIPFHGEPVVGLQVMGLLETRNLDFRNVVMLSVNEGNLPKSDRRPSIIPYTLRAAFGMTTIEKEVSLYAYYYYRLMQRAENITLLYNANTENGSKGEMSRFMLQTLAEAGELFGPDQQIEVLTVTANNETEGTSTDSIEKTAEVMEKLKQRFNEERILSPSAINKYMKCPLAFYFNYVAGLRPDKDVSDDVDNAMFGTIFHNAMERLLAPFVGRPIAVAELEDVIGNDTLLWQTLNDAFATQFYNMPDKDEAGGTIHYSEEQLHMNGTQLINRHVLKTYVTKQLEVELNYVKQLAEEGGTLTIVSQEQEYFDYVTIGSADSSVEGHRVKLGGVIDRLDHISSPAGDYIRIVDYKTSRKPQRANTVADLFEEEECTKTYHIMQTFYYCKVLSDGYEEYQNACVRPSLMYCAQPAKNPASIIELQWGTPPEGKKTIPRQPVENYKEQYATTYENLLMKKIKEIFTSDDEAKTASDKVDDETKSEVLNKGRFAQCTDEQRCQYCDFLSFCRRHPKEFKF